jgi:hypothetical protein
VPNLHSGFITLSHLYDLVVFPKITKKYCDDPSEVRTDNACDYETNPSRMGESPVTVEDFPWIRTFFAL